MIIILQNQQFKVSELANYHVQLSCVTPKLQYPLFEMAQKAILIKFCLFHIKKLSISRLCCLQIFLQFKIISTAFL